jgi:hypothetical protein
MDPRNIGIVPRLRLRERDLRGWFEMNSNWMDVLAERMTRRDGPVPQTLQPEDGERRPHMGYTIIPFRLISEFYTDRVRDKVGRSDSVRARD